MIRVLFTPGEMSAERFAGSQVAVLDVLRATSTIVTALANGATEVRLFCEVEEARAARGHDACVLGGERACVRIEGFDTGNSPSEYTEQLVRGSSVLLTTTNGTKAVVAVSAAARMYVASLLNASATAGALVRDARSMETVLVCSGTDGQVAYEDVLGAGAVLRRMIDFDPAVSGLFSDQAWAALGAFDAARGDLAGALHRGRGGVQLVKAGLGADLDVCARLDSRPVVARVLTSPLRAVVESAELRTTGPLIRH